MKKITTKPSFLGDPPRYVPAGTPVDVDEAKLSGNEKNLVDADGIEAKPVVAVAPIGPSGPRPTQPQQIPPDAVQTAGGTYATPQAKLIGAGHPDAEALMDEGDDTEGKLREKLAQARGGVDNTINDGSVDELKGKFGGMTDAQLQQLRQVEVNEPKPRSSLLSAVDAELEKRKGS